MTIDITKEVNRIPYAQLILIDDDAAQRKFAISNTTFFELGKEIEIKLRYEDKPSSEKTVFKGLVVRHSVALDEQISTLTLELKDAAIKLTQGRNSRVFLDQTDDKIIAKIIQDHGLRKGTIATTQPKHAEMIQYYSTDWDFMLLRVQSNGLLVNVDDGVISLPAITTGGSVKHRFEYGLDEIYDFELMLRRKALKLVNCVDEPRPP